MLLGIHVSKSSLVQNDKKSRELDVALKQDLDDLKLNAAQIFVMGPKIPVPIKFDPVAVKKVTADIDLTVHGCYASIGIWKVLKKNVKDNKSQELINRIVAEMRLAANVGAWGYVLHIAKMMPDDIAETMNILRPRVKKTGVILLLEMVASKSDPECTYETPEKLDNLAKEIAKSCKNDVDWYGFCVDTAHIWCAGQDITSYNNMKDWLDRFINKNKLKLFHINGCSSGRGSGQDYHEAPFDVADKIWHKVEPAHSGLKAVVEFAVANKVPMIMEFKRGTKKTAMQAINTIKHLGGL